jgi:hypothetical protein
MVAGTWSCEGSGGESGSDPDLVAMPWSSGFEHPCEFQQLHRRCYADAQGSFQAVTSPVRSGKLAEAFTVNTSTDLAQARCIIEGQQPATAYYGAWYYLPVSATSKGNWNLFHFRTGTPDVTHALWDVSLVPTSDDQFQLHIYDFLRNKGVSAADLPTVPLGSWFHIEFYLKRAADATGEVALFQDSEQILGLKDLITDDADWGQWYVGNLARDLMPEPTTVYVDDVGIEPALSP